VSDRYFIDGYNVLHADPDWSALADIDLEAARDTVVESVSRWCTRTGNRACVFFDGQGRTHERIAGDRGRPDVEIVFTSSRLSADAVIERGVYTAPKRDTVIVVTSDRGISDFCLGLGALTMRSDHFITLLREASRLPKLPGAQDNTLGRIEDRLDAPDSQRLRELRERLEEGPDRG
jgi:hypothetical protein